jgi:RNA polymerase sigma-70 factor (ECF subfamily)
METVEPVNELEVIRETLSGSPMAFAKIVRLHHRDIRQFVSKWIQCPAAADDVAQDVFVAAYENLGRFDGQGSLKPWLIGIAKNKTKQHLRSEARRRKHELNPLQRQIQEWKVQQFDGEMLIDEPNEHILLAMCIEQLAPESKRLIDEHYFEGKTLESIACESNRTGGSLRMMLLRIRKALAKCIRAQHQ